MRTLTTLLTVVLMAVLPGSAPAQTAAANKTTLRKLIREAKKDPARLFEAARFAERHDLKKDAEKLFKQVLKLSPAHEGANLAIGNVRHDGKWLPAALAEKLIAAELKAKYAAKGLVEVDGIWVEKDQVDDAKAGVFQHNGERVNRWEKQRLLQGKVRHPKTGRLIESTDKAKAEEGQFQVGDGKWADEEAADKYHANPDHPWMVRTTYCTVLSTLPLATIKDKVAPEVDKAYRSLIPILGGKDVHPNARPVIRVAANVEEYRQLGADLAGAESAYGAFAAETAEERLDGRRGGFAVANWHKDWGPYYTRHAAALTIAAGIAGDAWADLPSWFRRGLGGFIERHYSTSNAKHFGTQHKAKGGVRSVDSFIEKFEISNDLPASGFGSLDYNIYQAGLLIGFALRGGDKATTAAMQKVSEAFPKGGKGLTAAVASLARVLNKKEAEIKAYFAALIGG